MGKDKKTNATNRRHFFSALVPGSAKTERITLLTADGKLVEVDKAVLEAAAKKNKASNKDIYDWMKNPSKDNE